MRIDHSSTASASGEVTINTHPLGVASFHIYAIANREAAVSSTLSLSS